MRRALGRVKKSCSVVIGFALSVAAAHQAHAAPADAEEPEELVVEDKGTPVVPARLPERFAVMSFENRSGVEALDWMCAGVPFVLGEKVAHHVGLRPAYGNLVVPRGEPVHADAASVAEFGARVGARWVFTGWIQRPNWELRLSVTLWSVEEGQATKIGRVTRTNDFKYVHEMTGDAIAELVRRARLPLPKAARTGLRAWPTKDFYAFTLFGRGLAAMLGTTGEVELDKAAKDLTRAIFIDPTLVEGQRVVGELFMLQGKPSKARTRLDYAMSLRDDYYPLLAARARLGQSIGETDFVRELYVTMLRTRPYDLDIRYELGNALWKIGDADGAYLELKRVVDREPDHVRARRVLVMVYAGRGNTVDLVKELEAVARLDPDDVPTRVDLGAAYASVGKLDEAIATYESVVEDRPEHIQALKFLGDLHKRRGDTDATIRYYLRLLEVDDEDPRAYFLLGAAYVEAGDDAAAKRIYRRAQAFKKYLPQVWNNLGAIAYRQGRFNESIWYLSRAVVSRPGSARFRYNYALSLSSVRELDRAWEQIHAGLKLQPDHADLHYLKGVVQLRRGRVDAAQKSFERALELAPSHEDALHNLALLEEMRRRQEEGEVVIEGRRR